jgi:hypothetical protein
MSASTLPVAPPDGDEPGKEDIPQQRGSPQDANAS